MSARILVVDDIIANVKLLEAKLRASFYDVLTALNGADALEIAAREKPDLVLLDVMMPGMNGFEVCRRMKADPELRDIPVVMVTALDQQSDRIEGLNAGADDFLTKPPNDMALFARVRSLVRVKLMIDELRLRNATFMDFGVEQRDEPKLEGTVGRIVIAEPRRSRADMFAEILGAHFGAVCETALEPKDVLASAAPSKGPAPELFLIAATFGGQSGLPLCSELRARPDTRDSAILMISEPEDYGSVATALDLGAHDYLMRPVDKNELIVRTRAQLMRRRYTAQLRAEVDAGIRLAVTDPLTGLYNRRYADQHMRRVMAQNAEGGAPAAALLFDLDRFKSINDTYGHAAGDEVLIGFAERMGVHLRNVDLCARYGGEEFLALLPETDPEEALEVADRVRQAVAERAFEITGKSGEREEIPVTVSIGVATGRGAAGGDAAEAVFDLLARADAALYQSKESGRNRVTLAGAPEAPGAAAIA